MMILQLVFNSGKEDVHKINIESYRNITDLKKIYSSPFPTSVWTENHTLIYGISCEIRPMYIQNMQKKMLFGGTIYNILRIWE